MMQKKLLICMCVGFLTMTALSYAGNIRTYRQINDVATGENGKVRQSQKPGDLFEFTYILNREKSTITRSKVRRLDELTANDDATEYTITQTKNVIGSESGNGGEVFIAVRKDGGELLELGHRFAYTMRTSPFSQVITGVYKRVHTGTSQK